MTSPLRLRLRIAAHNNTTDKPKPANSPRQNLRSTAVSSKAKPPPAHEGDVRPRPAYCCNVRAWSRCCSKPWHGERALKKPAAKNEKTFSISRCILSQITWTMFSWICLTFVDPFRDYFVYSQCSRQEPHAVASNIRWLGWTWGVEPAANIYHSICQTVIIRFGGEMVF